MPQATMVIGCPASGKSSCSKLYIDKGAVHINRDKVGGSVIDLVSETIKVLTAGKDVVLDNTFPTAESRRPFIKVCKNLGVDIQCVWVATSIEDAQINALHRMYKLIGKICFDNEQCQAASHPNIFPSAVLFKYRKAFEKPCLDEGFSVVSKLRFVRQQRDDLVNKAVIFDYDGTLRDVPGSAQYKYPVCPSEVVILPGRTRDVFVEYQNAGYHLLGISNQSGIAKGHLTSDQAVECFEATNKLIGVDIYYTFCTHSVPPVVCYCRKPQSGLGVALIEQYKLDPAQVIMVGDQTTDKTFAKRLGFEYEDAEDFFKKGRKRP